MGLRLLEQSQLTTFIGVTNMWEATKTIDLIESVDEIRELTHKDGYRLIGTFKKMPENLLKKIGLKVENEKAFLKLAEENPMALELEDSLQWPKI